jgi:hypothetical protein
MTPVNMPKNVKAGLDTPEFFQKVSVAKTEIQVMFLRRNTLASMHLDVTMGEKEGQDSIPEDNESREYQSAAVPC